MLLAPVGLAQRLRAGLVATVFPEFIARDGEERADGGRQGEKRQGGAARSRPRRGHGLARLDGTRERATVADKVMKSGKTDRQATAGVGVNPTQAKRAAPQARRRQRWKPKGRDANGGSMRSTTARPGFAGRRPRRNSSIVMNASTCFVVMVLA